MRWHTQVIAVALPTISLFLFEDLRHNWLPQWMPGMPGNVLAAVVVALAAWGYVHLLTGVITRASHELARARERAAVLQERSRIAGDIHDKVAQALFLLGHRLAAGGAPTDLQDLVQKTAQEVRVSIRELRALTRGSLAQDVTALCAELEARLDLELHVLVDAGKVALPAPAQEQVLGLLREALTNVAKHSESRRAEVRLTRLPGEGCQLVVADRGRGFDPAAARGFGLILMQERAALAGASLTLISRPGDGCRVELRLPEEALALEGAGGG